MPHCPLNAENQPSILRGAGMLMSPQEKVMADGSESGAGGRRRPWRMELLKDKHTDTEYQQRGPSPLQVPSRQLRVAESRLMH